MNSNVRDSSPSPSTSQTPQKHNPTTTSISSPPTKLNPHSLLNPTQQHKPNQNVHLRRPRHRRQNRAPQSTRERLLPSRPRRRMPTLDETIPAMPENCPRGQLARVQRAEQRVPELSHGEGLDGAGRDEEFGVWRGTDCY